MKNVTKTILLMAFLMMIGQARVSSQSLCLETPATQAEIVTCNRTIAFAFAPEVRQWTRLSRLLADIPTAVNYDGDWSAINNWESLGSFPMVPSAYYAVWWLEDYWLIRYYFYYPRDWSLPHPICMLADQHEHDIETITVIVRRPSNQAEADDPSLLPFATSVSHHGKREYASCPTVSTTGGLPTGSHPVIHASIGSHALYYSSIEALIDSPINPCDPIPDFQAVFFPSTASPLPPISCIPGSCPIAYTLIDMFNPTMGLWAQRNNANLWDGNEFHCDNFNCKVGKPWGGNGSTPVCGFIDRVGNLCNSLTGEDVPANRSGCADYLYNGYCEPVITNFKINETYCCGDNVVLDGQESEKETRYKIEITEVGGIAAVETGWVDGGLALVNLTELWADGTNGGRFHSGKTYQVCVRVAGCTRGDLECKEFKILQPSFDFDLVDAFGELIPDGSSVELGTKPHLLPTELFCTPNFKIKICEQPIIDGGFRRAGDCTEWYYSGLQEGDDPVDLADAMLTDWWEPDFSFKEGYRYKICMYTSSICTVPLCKTIDIEEETDVVCFEESEETFPFCYEVITNCQEGQFCDPCFDGGSICLYNEDGTPLDMNTYVFSIDMGLYIIGSANACFNFSAQQAKEIQGFIVYHKFWNVQRYIPLELCDVFIDPLLVGEEPKQEFLARKQEKDQQSEIPVQLYPNPTSGDVMLLAPEITAGTIRLMDMNGRSILQNTFNQSTTIDLSGFAPGIYLVEIRNEEQQAIYHQKIIRQ